MSYPNRLTGEIREAPGAGAPMPLTGDMIQPPGVAAPPNQPAPQPKMSIGGVPVPDYLPGHAEPPRQPATPQPQPQTVVGQAFAAIANASKAFGDTVAEVAANRDLNEQGQLNALAAFAQTPIAKSVDVAEQVVADREAQAQAQYDSARAALVKPLDAAGETRATRYRDRLERELDSAKRPGSPRTPIAVAQDAVRDATAEQLSVVVAELPSLLGQHGVPAGAWLDQLLREKLPELAAAQQELQTAQRGRQTISTAANMVRNAITKGHPVPPEVLDSLDPAKIKSTQVDPDRQT